MVCLKKTVGIVVLVAVSTLFADVVVDDMQSTRNRTLADGIAYSITGDHELEVPPPPLPGGSSWSYYDLADDGKGETGQVARVKGTIGDHANFPVMGWGCHIVWPSDTLDLSQTVTHFAFRARGVGSWRFKFDNRVADQITLDIGRNLGQVAWRMPLVGLDPNEWQWFVLPVSSFDANVGAFREAKAAAGITKLDMMTGVYKVAWQTDGYTAEDAGEEVFLDVLDFVLVGSITQIGASTTQPDAETSAAIQSNLTSISNPFRQAPSLSNVTGNIENAGVYLLNGRNVGVYGEMKRTNQLPSYYILKFGDNVQLRNIEINR